MNTNNNRNKNKKMAKKLKPSPPRAPSSPLSSYAEEGEDVEEEEEEEEEEEPISNKPTAHHNQTHKPHTSSPSSSSSSSEEEEEEEEESDPEEDDEETEDSEAEKSKYIATLSKPHQPTEQKQQKEEGSDYQQDSGSGSSSESQKPKNPISSEKNDGHPKPNKPQANSEEEAAPSQKPQAVAEADENGSKKQKPGDKDEKAGVESKLPYYHLWSPCDVIALLKGMIEFAEQGPSDSSSDIDGFHQFISKLLTIKVTRRQLVSKINYMRHKYRVETKKVKEGIKPAFSNPHHKLEYQLSKKLWGENDPALEADDDMEVENRNGVDSLNTVGKGGGNVKKRMVTREEKRGGNAKKRRRFLPEEVKSEAVLYPHLNELLQWSGIAKVSGLSESDVKKAFQLMSPSQVKELDQRWRKLQSKQRDIHMERLTLTYELTKQFYGLVKSEEV